MKRLLCLLLCFCMTTSCISIANISAMSVEDQTYISAMNVFNKLIKSDENKKDISEIDTKVTRAAFVAYIVDILNLDYYGKEVVFLDIKQGDWAYEYVATLVERNVVSAGSKFFRPNDTIVYAEAATILLKLMGYQYYAELKGGYPIGYTMLASKFKLLPNWNESELNLADAIIMIVNALDCKMFESNKFGYEIENNTLNAKTMLERYRNIHKIDNVNVTNIHGIYGGSKKMKENEIELDEVVYTIRDLVDPYDYFARKVIVYYIDNDSNREVIYLSPQRDNEFILSAKDFISYKDGVLEYTEELSNNTYSEKIEPGAVYIYNNSIVTKQVSSLFDDFYKGSIILRDTNNSGKYDVVLIKSFHNHVASFYNSTNKIIYTSSGIFPQINLSLFDKVNIKGSVGNEVSPNVIVKDSSLTIAKSIDESYVEIIANTNIRTGILNSIAVSDETVMFDDTQYIVDKTYWDKIKHTLSIGDSYKFITDKFEEISSIIVNSTNEYLYGYLYGLNVRKGLDERLMVKLFNENSEFIVADCAANLMIDEIVFKGDALKAIRALPETTAESKENIELKPQIIRYSMNEKGEIDRIDTTNITEKENEEASLMVTLNGDDGSMHNVSRAARRFGVKTVIQTSTKVFIVPLDNQLESASNSQFLISRGMTEFLNNVNYTIWAFQSNKNSDFPDVILHKTSRVMIEKDRCNIMMVEKTANIVRENGEVVSRIYGLQLGKNAYCDVDINESISNVEQGDLIRYEVDTDNLAYDIEILYKASIGGIPTWRGVTPERSWYHSSSTYRQTFQLSFGYVSKKGNNVLGWGYSKGDTTDEVYDIGSFNIPIMVYDAKLNEKNRTYIGSLNDVLDYETVGDACSKIVFHTWDTNGQALAVYNY